METPVTKRDVCGTCQITKDLITGSMLGASSVTKKCMFGPLDLKTEKDYSAKRKSVGV